MSESDEERRDTLRRSFHQAKSITEDHEVLKENYLESLRENYFISRKAEDLAIYIDAGAEIDEVVRAAIVRALKGEDTPPHGLTRRA